MIVGHRFHPTPEEIFYLLKKKVADPDFSVQTINEVDIYGFDAWELPRESSIKTEDKEWYFFNSPSMYKSSKRTNRQTKSGYWKSTGQDRVIKSRITRKQNGMKKTLVFHERRPGSRKADKTNWAMEEYYLNEEEESSIKKLFVLCRIKRKSDKKYNSIQEDGSSQHHLAPNLENNIAETGITEVESPMFTQSEVLNGSIIEQSIGHQHHAFSNNIHTNMSSPNEAQSSHPQLICDGVNFDMKDTLNKHLTDTTELPLLMSSIPIIQESLMDYSTSIYDEHQLSHFMNYNFENHVTNNMGLEGEPYQNYPDKMKVPVCQESSNPDAFINDQMSADEIINFLCALENESSNLDTFNNDPLIKDDSTDVLWGLENGYFYPEPIVTLPL